MSSIYVGIEALTVKKRKWIESILNKEQNSCLMQRIGAKYGLLNDQINSYTGYALLKQSIYKLYGIEITYEDIGYQYYGKPYLKNLPQIHFNLSHAQDLVICTIGEYSVGVDIEQERTLKMQDLRLVLHERERDEIDKISNERDQQILFLKLWTAKESYLKYAGIGLKRELRDFEVALNLA